jgi:hypothetical protein
MRAGLRAFVANILVRHVRVMILFFFLPEACPAERGKEKNPKINQVK